jgi:hypothetical protein
MNIRNIFFLIGFAPCAIFCSDLSTFSSQFLDTLLPSSLDPAHAHIMPQLEAAAGGFSKGMNSSGYFPDVEYYDSSDRSDWAAAEHLRRCLIFGISSRSNLSVHFMDPDITASARLCLGAWLNSNFYNSNWSVQLTVYEFEVLNLGRWWMQFGTLQIVAKMLFLVPDQQLLQLANNNTFPRLAESDVAAMLGSNRVWGSLILAAVGSLNNNESAVDSAFALMRDVYKLTPGIDGMQPDFSYHMHGPLAYISYGYGSHFLTNALTMELAASGTRWAVSPDEWTALAAYLLDGSRWVVRGSEYMLSAAGRHNTYFFKADAYGLAAGHYHFYAAYPLFAAAFPALSLPPFDSPLSVQLVRILPNFFASRSRGSEVWSACLLQRSVTLVRPVVTLCRCTNSTTRS